MIIASISWVRNEADVIEAFVRHHSRFLDRMIIIDNRSSDNTGEILAELAKEGLPLDIRTNDSFAHLQGEALTAVLSELRANPPDIVIPLDADEFLWTKNSDNIRSAIEQVQQSLPSLVPWHTYVPIPTDDASETNVLKRIRHRKAAEDPQWSKVIIPKEVLRKNIKIRMGSHALVNAESDQNTEHSEVHSLFLGHFPVRSAEQIAGKVFGGWLSQVANPKRTKGAIFQWKTIFDELKSGKTVDAQMLMRLALEYGTQKQWQALPEEERGGKGLGNFVSVETGTNAENSITEDPIPAEFELRYPIRRLPSLQILADNAEYLAQEVARTTR